MQRKCNVNFALHLRSEKKVLHILRNTPPFLPGTAYFIQLLKPDYN